jgi:tetratricopeptide (TPR) repeat protein
MKKGDFDKGLAYAREAEGLDSKNSLPHNLVGRILYEMGETAESIPELEEATKLAPNIADFHMNLARAYQKAGNRDMAAKELAAFNQLDKKRNEVLQTELQHEREVSDPAIQAAPQ